MPEIVEQIEEEKEKLGILNLEEIRRFEAEKKDIEYEIDKVFDVKFKDLNLITAEDFFNSIESILAQLDVYVRENMIEVRKHITEKNYYVDLAIKNKINPNDPYRKAVVAQTEALKKLAIAQNHRVIAIELVVNGINKLIEVIKSVKNVQVDKMRTDVAKDLYGDVISKKDKDNERLQKELSESREFNIQLSEKVRDLADIVLKSSNNDRERELDIISERKSRLLRRQVKEKEDVEAEELFDVDAIKEEKIEPEAVESQDVPEIVEPREQEQSNDDKIKIGNTFFLKSDLKEVRYMPRLKRVKTLIEKYPNATDDEIGVVSDVKPETVLKGRDE